MTRVLAALTGASGALYGVRLVERLLACGVETDVVVSDSARQVLAVEHDLGGSLADHLARHAGAAALRLLDNGDMTAPPASGSTAPDAMIVAPCSMGTLARIASGVSTSLVERAADVMLKERRPLVLVPRETPLSTVHLRNMLALSEMGVRIVPASPAFYFRPESIEDLLAFVVDRAIQCAGLALPLRHPWEAPARRRGRP